MRNRQLIRGEDRLGRSIRLIPFRADNPRAFRSFGNEISWQVLMNELLKSRYLALDKRDPSAFCETRVRSPAIVLLLATIVLLSCRRNVRNWTRAKSIRPPSSEMGVLFFIFSAFLRIRSSIHPLTSPFFRSLLSPSPNERLTMDRLPISLASLYHLSAIIERDSSDVKTKAKFLRALHSYVRKVRVLDFY